MSLFITRPSTHSSVLPSVHPSAKFAPLVLAGVGLLLDPERRYMAPWSKRRRHSLAAAVPLPRSHESAALPQATFWTLNLKIHLSILISKIMHPHPHSHVHLYFNKVRDNFSSYIKELYIFFVNITKFEDIYRTLFISVRPSARPSIHPSAQLAPSAFAGVGLSLHH